MSFKVKLPLFNLKNNTSQDRLQHLKEVIRENRHIQAVEEKFKKENRWLKIDFDCNYSREKAIKEDKEWKKRQIKAIYKGKKDNRPNTKPKRPKDSQKKKQEEGRVTKTEKEIEQTENQNKDKAEKMLTIWDLPVDVTEKEIKYICRNIKEIQIVRIKRSSNKALAVVKSNLLEEARASWSLPIGKRLSQIRRPPICVRVISICLHAHWQTQL